MPRSGTVPLGHRRTAGHTAQQDTRHSRLCPRGSGSAAGRAAEQHSRVALQGSSVSRVLGAVPGLHGCSVTPPCVVAVLNVLGCLWGDWFVAQPRQSRRRRGLLC